MNKCAENLAVWISKQKLLPYKTRRSLIRRFHPPMLADYPFEADFYGLKFRGNIVNYIDRLIYFCGGHEKYMLHFLRDFVAATKPQRNGPAAFVDVGANAGNHSLFMSQVVEKVYAFEPFERVRKQLQENIKLNNISNIKVFSFGLGKISEKIPFYTGPDSNLGSSSFCSDHRAEENKYLTELEVRNGDEVLAQEGISNISIIKADVEGFERFVMEGLANTIRKCRPLCIIELSAKTRETLAGFEEMQKLFPEDYSFYFFRKGNRDNGAYKIRPFNYDKITRIEDVIACPDEWKKLLPI